MFTVQYLIFVEIICDFNLDRENMKDSLIVAKDAVIELFKGVMPERNEEIEDLWNKYDPNIFVVDDARSITLNSTRERIKFNPKMMDIFWLIGFSGWRAIECYSPYVLCSSSMGQTVADLIQDDKKLIEIERDYKERRATIKSLINAISIDDIRWPPDLPRPSANRAALESLQYKAAYDLTLFAVAFTLLHEFHHVMLDIDGQRPNDQREEELLCDVWAREMMTVKLEQYSKRHGHSYHEVLRKRSMGLALAALILHDITPECGHSGNCDYFPLQVRLKALLSNTPLPENDGFWVFTSSLLIGVYRQQQRPISFPPENPRTLTNNLIDAY